MRIQRCKKCGTKFKYMNVLDSIGWGYKPLNCEKCGAQHNLKMLYILSLAIVLSLPIFFIAEIKSFMLKISLNITFIVLIYIFYISIIVGLYPFIIRYRLEKDRIQIVNLEKSSKDTKTQ